MFGKRIVYIVVGVLLLAAVAGGGYWWYETAGPGGSDVVFLGDQRVREPRMNYAEMEAIPGPVYLFGWAWAARPDLDDRSSLVPPGVEGPAEDPPYDVFYVHNTTYWGDEWNAHHDDAAATPAIDGPLMALEASVFNNCCRVYAPRYRQAHGAGILKSSGNGRTSFDLANVDVERAFHHYLTMENKGRPFFIVGHGQGAQQAMRLIDRRIESVDENYENFIAAYLIGIGVPMDRFGTAWKRLTPCETAWDVGCIASWEAYAEGSDPVLAPNFHEVWYSRRWTPLATSERLCTNPLTWRLDGEAAPANANLGSLVVSTQVIPGSAPSVNPSDYDVLPELVPGYAGARCENGYLFVDLPDDTAVAGFGPDGGNLDPFALTLFWANVRANLDVRAQAFLDREAQIDEVKAANRARMEAEIAAQGAGAGTGASN